MSGKYKEILDYAEKNGLILSGYSYEMIINESVIGSTKDSIVQIEIPFSDSLPQQHTVSEGNR